MVTHTVMDYCWLTLALALSLHVTLTQTARWCTVNSGEKQKCVALKTAVKALTPPLTIDCVDGIHRYDCMMKIKNNDADLIVLSDSDIYPAGKKYGLVPIMQEKDNTDASKAAIKYKAVAVVKKTSNIKSLADLKGKKSCHTGVGRTVGWRIPVSVLFSKKVMPITDCDNNVKNVANFFGQSCAYGAFSHRYNPAGDNPQNICTLCQPAGCNNSSMPYAGYNGAFKCLVEVGDVAFVKHTTYDDVKKANLTYDEDEFELLCPDNRRKLLTQWYDNCDWGTRPTNAVMTRADANMIKTFKKDLKTLLTNFGPSSSGSFKLFSSGGYTGTNLMFSDSTMTLLDVGTKNDSMKYLGTEYAATFEYLRPCKNESRWCTVSQSETNKCMQLSAAATSKYVSSELKCVQGTDQDDCLTKIKNNEADMIDLDGSEAYKAGKYFDAIPFASENYAAQQTEGTDYWAVAVVKKTSPNVNINNLKGKKSCHTGFGKTSGWTIPVSTLVDRKYITLTNCNAGEQVGKFFSESCVPGALDKKYNPYGKNPESLCALCGGKDKCQRSSQNKFYGYKGSFRCLVETDADVAFVKHTTVKQYTDGASIEAWAKSLKSTEFELMCLDGSRKSVEKWTSCNLAKVPAHVIVTSKNKNSKAINHYQKFLLTIQASFMDDSNSDFPMFSSPAGTSDLMFKDSTTKLSTIPADKQTIEKWFPLKYYQAVATLDPIKCRQPASGSGQQQVALGLLMMTIGSFLFA